MSSEAGTCEGCSAHFSLFKRKKVCTICKQDFCQSCLTRQNGTTRQTMSSSNGTKERICIVCQHLSSNSALVDDIMKYKTKHLRIYLQAKNIPTNTCKEKRELADLIIRNSRNNPPQQQHNPPPRPPPPTFNPPPPPPPPPQQNRTGNGFNDTIQNFMSNVQDFVNYNVNAAFSTTAASSSNNGTTASSSNSNDTGRRNSRTTTTTSSSTINPDPNTQQQQQQSSASFGTNFNDVLNYIGNQIPPVIQQTFTNNRYTFNNVFNGGQVPSSTSSSSSTSNLSGHRSNSASASNLHTNNENEQHTPPTPPPPPPPQAAAASNDSNSTTSQSTLKRRASVSDLTCQDDIENLTVRQMKEILASNFVDYKGVCERNELIDRVKILYESHVRNKKLTDEINQNCNGVNSNSNSDSSKPNENELCKICCDAVVDCVLLDCGHMISCTKCGKRLAECPICRKNIIKVVRVFKS